MACLDIRNKKLVLPRDKITEIRALHFVIISQCGIYPQSDSMPLRKCYIGSFREVVLKYILGKSSEKLWVEAYGSIRIKDMIFSVFFICKIENDEPGKDGGSHHRRTSRSCLHADSEWWRLAALIECDKVLGSQSASTGTAKLPLENESEQTEHLTVLVRMREKVAWRFWSRRFWFQNWDT